MSGQPSAGERQLSTQLFLSHMQPTVLKPGSVQSAIRKSRGNKLVPRVLSPKQKLGQKADARPDSPLHPYHPPRQASFILWLGKAPFFKWKTE